MEHKDEKSQQGKKERKVLKFILSHKLVFFLLLLVVAVFLWAVIKMEINDRRFESEKKQMAIVQDSLATANMELTAKVFAWAVRSEMTRENLEQVNQFFLNFIKEPGISKIELVDFATKKVIVSTDKRDEGTQFTSNDILDAETIFHETRDSIVRVVSPVMGLNSKIGVLVIEKKRIARDE